MVSERYTPCYSRLPCGLFCSATYMLPFYISEPISLPQQYNLFRFNDTSCHDLAEIQTAAYLRPIIAHSVPNNRVPAGLFLEVDKRRYMPPVHIEY